MPLQQDAFGKALYSYWKGDHKTPCFIRRDDNYTDKSLLKTYFAKNIESEMEKDALQFAKGKILDVGCGAGRHTLYLQKKGFDVTGIDFSPLAIKTCKARGCKKVKVMDVFKAKFKPNSFDTILLFGNNLGIGGSLTGVKKLLKKLKSLIKPHGHLLLTSMDVTKTTKEIHQNYHQRNQKAGRYIGIVKIRIEYKDLISDWFQWAHVEPEVLQKIAKETGWNIKQIFKQKNGEYSAVLEHAGNT